MSNGRQGQVLDRRGPTTAGTGGAVVEELAACLERFLAATADEQTLIRARAALEVWHGRP